MPRRSAVRWPSPSEAGVPRHKPRQWERAGLQPAVFRFAESQVLGEKLFFSVDRAAPVGNSHVVEALRGLKAGLPDTWLLLPSRLVACELKVTGNPRDEQEACGRAILALGHHWFWTQSVLGYGAELERIGVGLRRHWRVVAEDEDLRLKARRDSEMANRKAARRQASLRFPP